ncbi:methyltransferase domain-containing protein [Paenibacillus sp. KQZ6P-2]|uniref:Methyltransferase domain-containing protein n=1 Tax=Paenibacillus mangrovi TaxID=2931978 RepID=A0A9X1WLW0_9BACL|nr:class I SAM-dependent methyltransferase [Paenibacillus mangrovi]MCJ8010886.1 methyltransferase domain-containing protein [Paenibacillus mangrovi]
MNYFDILAALGEGAAHPGGFESTMQLLQDHAIPRDAHILEVGCGTGRTACCMAQMGYSMTAVDLNPVMINKAIKRAELQNVAVDFKIADATSLLFDAGQFDVVFVESVTLFVEIPAALQEYYRVLAGGGRLYDREMVQKKSHPELLHIMKGLYGNLCIPSILEWRPLMEEAGFENLEIWNRFEDKTPLALKDQHFHPDPLQMIDMDILYNCAAMDFLERNQAFFDQFGDYLSYSVFIGEKRG